MRYILLYAFAFLSLFVISGCESTRRAAAGNEKEEEYLYHDLGEITITNKKEYHPAATRYFDLLHTRLELTPMWDTQQLKGKAILILTPYAYPQDSLVLNARSFDIESIDMYENRDFRELRYSYDKMRLYIALGRTYRPGDSIEVEINYTARPERQITDSVIRKDEDKGLFFINASGNNPYLPRQLWTQGETNHNSAWFPTIDEPNEKFTHEIHLTVDTALTTLSNGAFIYSSLNGDGTRTDVWEMAEPHSAYLVMIAAGNWKVVHDNWRDSIPVNYYVEPKYAPYAQQIFGNTPEMMEFFSRLLKYDYPWAKYSQVAVREFVSGAMENTTAVVHFEGLQQDTRGLVDNSYEEIIAHELFHHWFGDLVTCESWAQLTLNESFATYGTVLWEDYKYGKEHARHQLQENLNNYLQEAAFIQEPILNFYYRDAESMFDRHRYEKGSLVLHMLRHELGDRIFFQALHNYLVRYEYQTAELAGFRMVCEELSGRDLTQFFSQWFEKPGHPVLDISQRYDAAGRQVWLHVTQKQANEKTPAFSFPVKVAVYKNATDKDIYTINVRNASDSFAFPAAQAPALVIFDTEKYLLCDKSVKKPAAQWYLQYFAGSNYNDRYEAIVALGKEKKSLSTDSLDKITDAALKDAFWNIRRLAVSKLLEDPSSRISGEIVSSDDDIMVRYRRKITDLALKDPHPDVRKAALYHLSERRPPWREEVYRQALRDSSYQVVSWALASLANITSRQDSAKVLAMLKPFESYNSGLVTLTITDIYARYAGSEFLDYFHTAPYKLQTFQASGYINDYKELLLKLDVETIMKEKDFILALYWLSTDAYSRLLYKKLLTSTAEKLKGSKNTGAAENERKEMVRLLENKADEIQVKFSN